MAPVEAQRRGSTAKGSSFPEVRRARTVMFDCCLVKGTLVVYCFRLTSDELLGSCCIVAMLNSFLLTVFLR